jgi:hypothetical protein
LRSSDLSNGILQPGIPIGSPNIFESHELLVAFETAEVIVLLGCIINAGFESRFSLGEDGGPFVGDRNT